jgi:Cu+-exporting ATPase
MSIETVPAPAERREATLEIEGMTCASCVARVEKRLRRVPGVGAEVNLATESARVSFPADTAADELVEAVRAAGYGARVRVERAQPTPPRSPPPTSASRWAGERMRRSTRATSRSCAPTRARSSTRCA